MKAGVDFTDSFDKGTPETKVLELILGHELDYPSSDSEASSTIEEPPAKKRRIDISTAESREKRPRVSNQSASGPADESVPGGAAPSPIDPELAKEGEQRLAALEQGRDWLDANNPEADAGGIACGVLAALRQRASNMGAIGPSGDKYRGAALVIVPNSKESVQKCLRR